MNNNRINRITLVKDVAIIWAHSSPSRDIKPILIDLEDLEKVNKYRWHIDDRANMASSSRIKDKSKSMHRLIMNPKTCKVQIDHIDGDRLDNRKCNLRIATNQQNNCNRGPQSNNTSGYKGVSWNKTMKKYEAYIKYNNKKISLGFFNDKEEAASIRDKKAKELHKEFAWTH